MIIHTQLRIPQGAAYRDIAISFLQWCNVKDREGNGHAIFQAGVLEWGAIAFSITSKR